MHKLFRQSIIFILKGKTTKGADYDNSHSTFHDLTENESRKDGFSIERAAILYHIARFSLKNYDLEGSRYFTYQFHAFLNGIV